MKYYFTSESVTEGHPDKICDKISDRILDEALKQDQNSKMAVEATIKNKSLFIYGEASTKANLDYESLALDVLDEIGYGRNFKVIIEVSKQSSLIEKKVVQEDTRAGDQGIMFGYACSETEELMPLPIMLANKLVERLDYVRHEKLFFLKPDGKSQVTVEYQDDIPQRIDTIVVAYSHNLRDEEFNETYNSIIKEEVIDKVIPESLIDKNTKIVFNPFTLSGPFADSGTTGRKIVCDTYGGASPVGGGCFSSKDPSKVDRSASYYARYVAKNIIAHNLASKCVIQVSYIIGNSDITSIFIDTFGTNKVPLEKIYSYVETNFSFKVSNIISELNLLNPIYYSLASYGHFGRNNTWEQIKN